MAHTFLLLNSGKTEILVVSPKSIRNKNAWHFTTPWWCLCCLECSHQKPSFANSYKKTSRIAFFHLKNIAKIRKMQSVHDAEKLVHAFVTSRLDYCNALLSGCANTSLKPLQLVQNAAARILTRTKTLWAHYSSISISPLATHSLSHWFQSTPHHI